MGKPKQPVPGAGPFVVMLQDERGANVSVRRFGTRAQARRFARSRNVGLGFPARSPFAFYHVFHKDPSHLADGRLVAALVGGPTEADDPAA